MFVHLSPDEVAVWSVVAGVQRSEPLPVTVRGGTTTNLIGVSPDQLGVVTNGSAEFEGLNLFSAKERHLIIPVGYSLCPFCGRESKTLLVNVQVLANSKPVYASTDRAVMRKFALVCMPLSNCSKLVVPNHASHVGGGGLWPGSTSTLLAASQLSPETIMGV